MTNRISAALQQLNSDQHELAVVIRFHDGTSVQLYCDVQYTIPHRRPQEVTTSQRSILERHRQQYTI